MHRTERVASVVAVVVAGIAAHCTAGASTRHVTSARAIQFCVPGRQLTGAVSPSRDALQASRVTLALTNRSARCKVAGALWVQFHGAKGGPIGPLAMAPALSRPRVIHQTFQLVAAVQLAFGQACARAIGATSVRIGIDGSSVAVPLRAPERICVRPFFNAMVTPPTFPSPPQCTPSQLRTRAGFTQGAAGTLYTELLFINASRAACVVGGFPSVQGADGPGGTLVGPPARQIHLGGAGLPVMDLNHTGARTFAEYGHVDREMLSPSFCGPEVASGIEVSVLGYPATYLRLPDTICTKINSTTISHLGV